MRHVLYVYIDLVLPLFERHFQDLMPTSTYACILIITTSL